MNLKRGALLGSTQVTLKISGKDKPGSTNSTVDLYFKVACFVKMYIIYLERAALH
jgi:hypothetical protein